MPKITYLIIAQELMYINFWISPLSETINLIEGSNLVQIEKQKAKFKEK